MCDRHCELVAALLACMAFASTADAACEHGGCRHYHRSKEVWHQFVNTVPYPTQVTEDGDCPMTVDHFVPFCLGGPDVVANLWWEDRARAEWKDGIELRACRAMRRVERSGNDPTSRRAVVVQYLHQVAGMGGPEGVLAESWLQPL